VGGAVGAGRSGAKGIAAPYADRPPVLRILYAICQAPAGETAVVLLGGDKTALDNAWYPAAVSEAEVRRLRC
jgi:hypothetical protein